MKRMRCRPSLCGRFLCPGAAAAAGPGKPFPTPQAAWRALSTVSTRPNAAVPSPPAEYPAETVVLVTPSRDPLSSAKLAALHARLSLHPKFPVQTLARALIDQSAERDRFFNNSSLAFLGNTLLGYYGTEHFLCTYPRLPSVVLQAAMAASVGPRPLASIGREWGVESAFEPTPNVDAGLLQFKRLPPGTVVTGSLRPPRSQGVTDEEAMADFVRATFAGVYLHEGVAASKQFFRQHVLSRKLELDKLFNFVQPTRELSRLCAREGFDSPVARLLSETGRMTNTPVFIVGIYSGNECLGEGQGGSLNEARIKAAANVLKGWYLYRPFDTADVPSKTDVYPDATFKPTMIDSGEVIV
ncbi:54S ribosomal protein L3 mitochondrial [Maublancomyces gigas]|uniref:Large ribosomal subunit protein mL44 n=1 Tax=Discina gigas TaxID=1032678 RepID=A0ABR3GFA1_9PEZI